MAATGDELGPGTPHAVHRAIACGEDPPIEQSVTTLAPQRRVLGVETHDIGGTALLEQR